MVSVKRLPNLSKLSIAILESLVKPIVGDEAIKVLKEPVKEKELREGLSKVLSRAEKRFSLEYEDEDICRAILDLPYADLPSVRTAVREFYDHPSGPELSKLLREHLLADYPNLVPLRVERAVSTYLDILRQELISISDDIRQKLMALAMLNIQRSIEVSTEGDKLFNRFRNNTSLSKYIRTQAFEVLVNERTKNFVGREYIFRSIDDLVQDPNFPSGYILISGEPGIGKTALIAQLVKQRGYVHHFNIAAQNICHVHDFLTNICAQIIVRYNLDYRALPDNAIGDSGFLLTLLAEAVKTANNDVVIVVDALDEAEDSALPQNANSLYLPQVLPEGVFFIISTRTKFDSRLLTDRRRDIYIDDKDPNNLADVAQYIQKFLQDNTGQMESRIQEWDITKEELGHMSFNWFWGLVL